MKSFCLIICIFVIVCAMSVTSCNTDSNVVEQTTGATTEAATESITEASTEATTEPTTVETTIEETIEETTLPPTEATEETVKPDWEYDDSLSAEKNIFIYLTDYLGFSNSAACGIIANIAHETGWKFNPNAGDPSHCYGLIQWMGGRLMKLQGWCLGSGRDYTTIQGQLDFMYWELINLDPYGTYEHLINCEDSAEGAYDAGWYFCYWYERPSNKGVRAERRGNSAIGYYEKLVQG